ncbi:MAG TPA: alpha/beta hydrolase-fold protein, partial [Polyangia bacterium]|nr:alpha/beta hydrolase-fold protein [Polyangia bacterium]
AAPARDSRSAPDAAPLAPDTAAPAPDSAPASADAAAAEPPTSSEACGKGLPVPAEGVHQLMVGAMNRKFFLRLPSSYDGNKPWPVVFAFHGAGNKSASWFDTNTDLRPQLEEKAVLLFPEGPAKPDGSLSWVYLSPENVLFVDAMIDWLKKAVCIDPARLFATGQSSGGYMAMTLGCQRGTVFRAVATSSGGILEPGPCTGNPHVLMRTGKADTASTHDSVVKTRDFWLMHKGCSADPPRPIDPAPCVSYGGCGSSLIWCEDGGSHGWPGYATKAIWNLFSL